jgi:hypothetical protein
LRIINNRANSLCYKIKALPARINISGYELANFGSALDDRESEEIAALIGMLSSPHLIAGNNHRRSGILITDCWRVKIIADNDRRGERKSPPPCPLNQSDTPRANLGARRVQLNARLESRR